MIKILHEIHTTHVRVRRRALEKRREVYTKTQWDESRLVENMLFTKTEQWRLENYFRFNETALLDKFTDYKSSMKQYIRMNFDKFDWQSSPGGLISNDGSTSLRSSMWKSDSLNVSQVKDPISHIHQVNTQ